MIIKARARAGGSQLAAYLLNRDGEERAELLEMRGLGCFGGSLRNALIGVEIEGKASECSKPLYHASFRLEEGAELTPEQWRECADRLEKKLHLDDHNRALVMHEENGKKHLHVVWSRLDEETLQPTRLEFDAYKRLDVARELEKEFGTRQLSNEHTQEHPTRADHEQAKRQGRDIADIKAEIREAWEQSDNGTSFENALADAGYMLAKGDKRDFVAVDRTGQEYTIGKRITGATAAQVRIKTADLDRDFLPTVEEARAYQKDRQGQNQQQERQPEAEQKEPAPAPDIADQIRAVFSGAGVEIPPPAPTQEAIEYQQAQQKQAQEKPRLKFDLDREQWTTAAAEITPPQQRTTTDRAAALGDKAINTIGGLAETLENLFSSPQTPQEKALLSRPEPPRPNQPAPRTTTDRAAALGDKVLDVAGDLLGGIGGPVTHEQTRLQAAGTQHRTQKEVEGSLEKFRQTLTPQEREAKAKEFDRAAKEATQAREGYKTAAARSTGAEHRAAMRAEFRAEVAAKQAAKAAALLRETQQQREERQAKEREEREAERRRRERQRER